jgi:hypothetical protein
MATKRVDRTNNEIKQESLGCLVKPFEKIRRRETEELDSRIRLFDTDTFFWLVILSAR